MDRQISCLGGVAFLEPLNPKPFLWSLETKPAGVRVKGYGLGFKGMDKKMENEMEATLQGFMEKTMDTTILLWYHED